MKVFWLLLVSIVIFVMMVFVVMSVRVDDLCLFKDFDVFDFMIVLFEFEMVGKI